ncbi:MAG: iron-only hydrogenase system regulator [Lachnospiraceae bacterium]|nr:iron-only hydrogenase system regulator [Lachnospiraceae bacterium]
MSTRVAVVAIIVEEPSHVEELNRILSENSKYIIGRMGIPYKQRGINIISVAVDAPQDVISTMTGRIGKLPGVSSKTAYSQIVTETDD